MNGLYAVLVAGVLLGLYVILMTLNKKTPVPEGCENLRPDCKACGIADCAVRVKYEEKEGANLK
ncbi:MAG: hypothetical protein K6D03_05540 [Solobacterium sp.]|nr:hypothetical protein [Solobacterium sp.]